MQGSFATFWHITAINICLIKLRLNVQLQCCWRNGIGQLEELQRIS